MGAWKVTGIAAVCGAVLLAGCDTGTRHDPPATTPGTTGSGATGVTSGTAPVGTGTPTNPPPAPGGPAAPPPTSGPANPALAALQPDPVITDPTAIWHLDFDAHGAVFHRNCVAHGLGVDTLPPDAPINRLTREAVIARAVIRVNTAYRRNPDGTAIPGQSIEITFTPNTPDPRRFPDGPGRDYSRICIGSSTSGCGGGTLGVETLDFGNRRAERACQLDRLGTFAGRICGQNSVLGRRTFGSSGGRRSGGPLTAADLKYVDGTYRLGAGTAAEDRRFQEIDAVVTDWATAIGNVLAHEVGHAVGLQHVRTGVMIATTNARDLSNPQLPFSRPSLDVLVRNLGIQR